MNADTENQTPILVKNPNTNLSVNVAPLFSFINEAGGTTRTTLDIQEIISQAIRYINLAPASDSQAEGTRLALNYDLYRLEDMLKEMAKF